MEMITLQCENGEYICAEITGSTPDHRYMLEWNTNKRTNYATVPILCTRYVNGILNAPYSDVTITWEYDEDNLETRDWY